MTDLILAGGHHLLVFGLAMILAAEAALLRPEMGGTELRRLGRIDAAYGLIAVLILVVGFSRVFVGAKGADFYLTNPVFWTKLALFGAVGLMSILPTMRFFAWRRRARSQHDFIPPMVELRRVRGLIMAQALVFMAIPLTAAAMARGYGI